MRHFWLCDGFQLAVDIYISSKELWQEGIWQVGTQVPGKKASLQLLFDFNDSRLAYKLENTDLF